MQWRKFTCANYDTSEPSLWLLGWRKTVEGSMKCISLQNRCPYRQVFALTAVFADAKTPTRVRALARRPLALPQTLCVLGFLYRSRQFLLAQKRLRGCGLPPGGPWPCLRRAASSEYEDTSSLLLLGWRKTVEGSALFTGLQNRCLYRWYYRQVSDRAVRQARSREFPGGRQSDR